MLFLGLFLCQIEIKAYEVCGVRFTLEVLVTTLNIVVGKTGLYLLIHFLPFYTKYGSSWQ